MMMKAVNGLKDIFLNIKMVKFMLGRMELHLGQRMMNMM